MAYTHPPFDHADASWASAPSYTRPPFDEADASWVTGTGPGVVTGSIVVTTWPPTLPISAAARERPSIAAPCAWAKLAVARPPAPVPAAQVAIVLPAVCEISLSAPPLPLIAIARERAYTAAASVALSAPALSAPVPTAAGDMVQQAAGAITLPPPSLGAGLTWSAAADGYQQIDLPERTESEGVATSAAVIAGITSPYVQGATLGTGRTMTQHQMQASRAHAGLPAAEMERQAVARALRQAEAARTRRAIEERAHEAERTVYGQHTPHAEAVRIRTHAHERAHAALRCIYRQRTPNAEAVRTRAHGRALHHHGTPCAVPRSATHADTLRTATPGQHPWQQGMPPPPGRWWPFELVYCTPWESRFIAPYTRPRIWAAHASWASAEAYTRPHARCNPDPVWVPITPGPPPPEDEPIIVPIRRIYLVVNTFSLVLASNGAPIAAATFRAGLARDAWCWSWSARIPAEHLAQLRPDTPGSPVEVIAAINGTPLRLLVERVGRDRRFGSSWLSVSGRSRSAYLADPYAAPEARTNTDLRTAQQLLADALTVNGVPLGWTVDWRIEDWPVPAGAWSHTGTYIEAARRIAEAGGAYVQTHDTADTLIVLPQYPSAPWEWADETPDLVLPEDVVEVEGIEWAEKPAYNAVWIAGGEGGRLDRVRRGGTNGDRPAQTIVDALATDPAMTRQRGLPVLADTGRQARINLRLPVLQETGLIRPGALVRYTESGNTHHGLSRSVEVTMDYPQVWQTIQVETHEQPV